MLDQTVFVTTDLFEVTTPGSHFINERCFGEDFAVWLRARFAAIGVECSEPIQEDWGWVLLVKQQKYTFTVSIGVMDESIGKVPAEWRIGVTYERALNGIRNWFRSPPHDVFTSLFVQLRTILSDEVGFRVSDTEAD